MLVIDDLRTKIGVFKTSTQTKKAIFLTLITAFGIAIVKAYIVASNFMHLNIEKKYISYLLLTMVVLLGMFFFGTAADVMKSHGSNWVKTYHEQAVPAHGEAHQ